MIESLEPQTLRDWIAEARPFRLLDVREEAEWQISRLPGAELLPLSRLATWLPSLAGSPQTGPVVIYCHHGIRSARACAVLSAHGVPDVRNLAGGIERWSREIDPRIARY